jgi:redox-sensitive bicupin YhaK (pirin superfamily)
LQTVVFHPAQHRGLADYGWLKTAHTFNFSSYYHPERRRFGMLRVLNDDRVAPGKGFDTHPHNNMEIISIPLKGALQHRDSMHHNQIIREGEVQVMSAGTGVSHSEYNHSDSEWVSFLQIWIIPKQADVAPAYHQRAFESDQRINKWQLQVSGYGASEGLPIHQDARLWRGTFDTDEKIALPAIDPKHGLYLFVIEGSAFCGETQLERRDGLGLLQPQNHPLFISALTDIIAIDVPLQLS